MRIFSGLFLLILYSTVGLTAYADVNPPGFSADISKPTPEINVEPVQADSKPASLQSESAWANYDRPIRNCVQGDTILPSENNKILNFLFNNNADTNATMSIQGWKGSHCIINFSEGTVVKSCRLTRVTLNFLMDNLLNPTQFNINSRFAQTLNTQCQNTSQSA